MAMNNCNFTGRLTADPELKRVGNDGIEKVTFTLAVDRDRKREDGSRETDFLDFVAWRGTAKFISEHFRKGDAMTVTNVREAVREYTDKDGIKRRKHEHEVSSKSDIYFGSRRKDRQDGYSGQKDGSRAYSRESEYDDDGYPYCEDTPY